MEEEQRTGFRGENERSWQRRNIPEVIGIISSEFGRT